jgi:type IV secretory pathway TrbF-like protein
LSSIPFTSRFRQSGPGSTIPAAEPISKEDLGKSELEYYKAGKRTHDTARREDRAQIKTLRIALFGVIAVAGITAAMDFKMSGRQLYIPYLVQTDQRGRVINSLMVSPAADDQEDFARTKVVKEQLRNWVEDLRSVTTDPMTIRRIADNVYSMLDANGPALKSVERWMQTNDPRQRAKTVHVDAYASPPVERSATSYEVYWQEKTYDLAAGTDPIVQNYRMVIEITIRHAKDPQEIRLNPYGIWIERVSDPVKDNATQ